jgi:hemolysin D
MKRDKASLPRKLRSANPPPAVRRRPRQPLTDLSTVALPRADRAAGDRDFLPVALEIVETPPSLKQALLAYGLCGLIAAAILWSIFGHLTTYAIATGELRAVGESKVVEPITPGQVSAIRVKDGDRVRNGDALVELNPTDALAARTIIKDKLFSERAEIALRRVEIDAAHRETIDPKPGIAWDADIPQPIREREEGLLQADLSRLAAVLSDFTAQHKAKETARDGFSASMTSEKALITARVEHVGMHEQLEIKGWDSRARVLEALEPLKEEQVALSALQGDFAVAVAAIAVIDSEIVTAREAFIAENTQKMAAADRQVDDLSQQLTKADETLRDMTLRAPIDGIVYASAVTTIGQVVRSGQQLMQIVPEGAPLEIVAYVLNTDIGFVRVGQPAVIKIDTFPYTRYGTIAGTVTKIAADAISGDEALRQQKNGAAPVSRGTESDTAAAQRTKDLVFPVNVAPASSMIEVDGKKVALSSGMSVIAEITTGQHRAISYIMYPLVRGAPQSEPK